MAKKKNLTKELSYYNRLIPLELKTAYTKFRRTLKGYRKKEEKQLDHIIRENFYAILKRYPEYIYRHGMIYHVEYLKKIQKRNSNQLEDNLAEKHLDPYAPDIIEQISNEYFINNKEIISFTEIRPLIGNKEFIDLIVKAKINFTAKTNKDIAEAYCDTLLYLSDKKALGRVGNHKAGKNTIEPANKFAKEIGPILDELESEGFKTLQSKADELNAKKIKTLRDKNWNSSTVKRTWERWQALKDEEENEASTPSKGKAPKPE